MTALVKTTARLRHGQPLRFVCYGDSISEVGRTPGWFGGASDAEGNWGNRLRTLLADAYPASWIDWVPFGIGGQNSYEGLGRLDFLRPLVPDLTIVAFGANDCGFHPLHPAESEFALTSLAQAIRAVHDSDVIMVGTGGDNPLQSRMQHVNETISASRQAAAAAGVAWVDIRSHLLSVTDQGKQWGTFHTGDDDCHPNDVGHRTWASAVFEVLLASLGPAPK